MLKWFVEIQGTTWLSCVLRPLFFLSRNLSHLWFGTSLGFLGLSLRTTSVSFSILAENDFSASWMKSLQLDFDQVWVWLTGSSSSQQPNLMGHVHWYQQENKQVQKCKSSLEKFCSTSKPVWRCLCVWELVQSGNAGPYFFLVCVQLSQTSQTLVVMDNLQLSHLERSGQMEPVQVCFILRKWLLGNQASFPNPARMLWQTEEEAGRQCSLCRALSGHSRPAGLSLLSGNVGNHTLVLRQDCRRWQIPLPGETSQHLLQPA